MGRLWRWFGAPFRGATKMNSHKNMVVPYNGPGMRSVKRETILYDGDSPNSIGFTINETWGALKRCWSAYRVAAKDDWNGGARRDPEKALLYAKRIRKLQFELGISISEFPDLGLLGTEPEDVDLLCD